MPLYEYECKKCHHRFERIVKFSDKPMKKCPDCGGQVEQMISAPAVQFKGSGWYVTDYAKKNSAAAPSPSATDGDSSAKETTAKDSGSKDSTKKDDKPKTESKTDKKKADKK